MVLSERTFKCLLVLVSLLPLIPLGSFFVVRPLKRALWAASLGLFLCVAATLALWGLTNGQTMPPLADWGIGLRLRSLLEVALCCLLSFGCGVSCVRAYPWALFWVVPMGLLLAGLGWGAWRVFH